MPKNVVMLFLASYDTFGKQMYEKMHKSKYGPNRQVVKQLATETKYVSRSRQKPATFSKRISTLFRGTTPYQKYQPNVEPDPDAIADAYKFLRRHFAEEDNIILVGVARVPEDNGVIMMSIAELTKHLNNGTEPPGSPPRIATKAAEVFEPEQPHPNLLVRRQIPTSCVTLIYHSDDINLTSFNNHILNKYPLSVKRFVCINYAPGMEATCDTVREPSGGIKSRDVWFFNKPCWQLPFIIYATMGYIQYHLHHTQQWDGLRPVSTSTVLLSCPPFSRHDSAQGDPNITQPPGVNRLQVFGYKAFGQPEGDYHLPRRVLWSARRVEEEVLD